MASVVTRVDHPLGSRRVHVELPLAPASCRGRLRPALEDARASENLQLCELPQSQAYAVGVDEPVLGCVFRHLRSPLFDGYLVRQENFLMAEYQTFEHD